VFALVSIFTDSLPVGAEVRVPRDSAIVTNRRIPTAPPPVTMPPRESPPEWTQRRPSPPPFPDPGVRPLWIPDTDLWNGFRRYRVPGHWAW